MDKAVKFLRPYFISLNLLSGKCFDELFIKLNLGATECLLNFVSKGLGLAIVAGSLLVKFPQLLKLISAGSAEGLSFIGVLLELLAVTGNGAYSYGEKYPFSAYGEAIFLALQTALIAVFILKYKHGVFPAFLFALVYGGFAFGLTHPKCPKMILWYGQAANIPMVVVGKLMQIISNFRNGHTGQLSAITIFLLAAGSIARIFTSIRETGDSVVIANFVTSSILSSIIALQVIYYWNTTNQILSRAKAKKRN